MAITFSDYYELDTEVFAATGAFDVIIDTDSLIFIDPVLLELSDAPEFSNCKQKVTAFFKGIVSLLSASKTQGDMFWKQADRNLTFKETRGTCFGYSKTGTSGNSIGSTLRKEILVSISELLEAGLVDPAIFELIGVFQEKVGCDRISDMLTYILKEEILKYSQRIAREFDLADMCYKYKETEYSVAKNFSNSEPILLLPKALLSPLPIAECYDDIDIVCKENQRVRDAISSYLDLGRRKKLSKKEIFSL